MVRLRGRSRLPRVDVWPHRCAPALPHPDYIAAPSEVGLANKTTRTFFFLARLAAPCRLPRAELTVRCARRRWGDIRRPTI